GLGEAVVAGEVSPDNHRIDRESGDPTEVTVADKKTMCVKDPETGETTMTPVPDDKREARVLDDDELDSLVAIGEQVEDHYGDPQDVEWASFDDEVFMLQSRPITTIADADESSETGQAGGADGSGVVAGSGAKRSDGGGVLAGLGGSRGT